MGQAAFARNHTDSYSEQTMSGAQEQDQEIYHYEKVFSSIVLTTTVVTFALIAVVLYSFGFRQDLLNRAAFELSTVAIAEPLNIQPEYPNAREAANDEVWKCGEVFTSDPLDSSLCSRVHSEPVVDYRGNKFITPKGNL